MMRIQLYKPVAIEAIGPGWMVQGVDPALSSGRFGAAVLEIAGSRVLVQSCPPRRRHAPARLSRMRGSQRGRR